MNAQARILVVEDEKAIAIGLRDDLEVEGYRVEVAGDGPEGESRALTGEYDLIVLDLMLPRKDGLAVLRTVRAAGVRTPVIILTARVQEAEKVLGLELGADDYVTKPFGSRELLARVRAVLRRVADQGRAGSRGPHLLDCGSLHVDFDRYEASRAGQPIGLTPTEFRLLAALVRHRGRALTVSEIIEQVWGPNIALTDRVVYTHVNKLRGKIEADPGKPALIVGVRGVGYRFDGGAPNS